jgi:hypothetical protein
MHYVKKNENRSHKGSYLAYLKVGHEQVHFAPFEFLPCLYSPFVLLLIIILFSKDISFITFIVIPSS